MQMIRCFLMEDDSFALQWLIDILESGFPEIQIVGTASTASAAVRKLNRLKPDLILTDVELGKTTCFSVLDQLKTLDFGIIFITSFEKYALRAIKLSAIDYITKPVEASTLEKAIDKYKENRKQSEQIKNLLNLLKKEKGAPRIAIATGNTIEFFELDTILYFEADINYCLLHLENGRTVLASKTLKEFDLLLTENDQFIRIHRSYLINKQKIVQLHRTKLPKVTMPNGKILPISKTRKVSFEEKMHLR